MLDFHSGNREQAGEVHREHAAFALCETPSSACAVFPVTIGLQKRHAYRTEWNGQAVAESSNVSKFGQDHITQHDI